MKIFISCVSKELLSYRSLLTRELSAGGDLVHVQEHFPDWPGDLLSLIEGFVEQSDFLVHLVGRGVGASPKKAEVDAILGRRRNLVGQIGFADEAAIRALSYTQWEYWLARYHKKPCLVYRIPAEAEREADFKATEESVRAQEDHLDRIRTTAHYRREVAGPWELCARVQLTLRTMATGANPGLPGAGPGRSAAEAGPPAIVLGFRADSEGGHRSSGALRWRGRTIRLDEEQHLDVTKQTMVCDRLSELIRRGNVALMREEIGTERVVIELVLPRDLIVRPLSEWTYYHNQDRNLGRQPIRAWHPIRLRVAERAGGQSAALEIRSRLEVLDGHLGGTLAGICCTVPEEELAPECPRPLALVHDGNPRGCWHWHPPGVVCGGFTRPPPPPPRVPFLATWAGRPRRPKLSDWDQALNCGVPFLIWAEAPAKASAAPTAAQMVAELGKTPRPARMCSYFFQAKKPFVVLAESHESAFPESAPLFSETSTY